MFSANGYIDLPDRTEELDAGWFADKRRQYTNASETSVLAAIVSNEVDALEAFYNYTTTAEETAYTITNPIATSPLQYVRGYPDESVALTSLWYIIWHSLFEWPSSRLPDVFALLTAIKHLPKTIQIHNGEATDNTGTRPLEWADFPWFHMVWRDTLLEPWDVASRGPLNRASVSMLHREYLYRKGIEAQLISRGVLTLDRIIVNTFANTLEMEPDEAIAVDEGLGYKPDTIEYQVPGLALLVKYCRVELFNWVVEKNRDEKRWLRWEARLKDIAENEADEPTRVAARAAYTGMRAVRCRL